MPNPGTNRRQFLWSTAALTLAAQVCNHANAQETGPWRSGPELPEPVQEIYPCAHNGRIHLAGGFISSEGQITGPSRNHISLDPKTERWIQLAPLPEARHHPHLVSFRGKLHAVGGFASSPDAIWQMQQTIWIYDDEADFWTSGPSLPSPNGESVTAVIDEALHVAGGRHPKQTRNRDWSDHVDTSKHWRFDGNTWQSACPLPTPRNSAAGALVDGQWHVVGGRTVGGGNLSTHEIYDTSSDRWTKASPMPQAQGGLAAASLSSKLYAFGGEYFDRGGGVYAECWVYDPVSDSWDQLPNMPHPRHGLGGVAIGSDIYLIGGALRAGGNETSPLVEIFRPESI